MDENAPKGDVHNTTESSLNPDVKHELEGNDEFVKTEKEESPDPDSPPSGSPPSTATGNHANPKRTTRKSTLTQQQKNSKRQRATQDQLNTLEVEFRLNPTPNASVRERIAGEITMTERSVQIWFQNRRAKIKNQAKKSYETGEEADIPDSMRKYLAMQALESGHILDMPGYFASNSMGPFGPGLVVNTEASPKVMISHMPVRSLTIGTWRRIGQTQLDLVVFYSPTKSTMTYYIQAESTGFRIEYLFSNIKSIRMEHSNQTSNAEVGSAEDGVVIVELFQPPGFTMDPGTSGWAPCSDFTEDLQASKSLVHRLGGTPKALQAQLHKLTQTDAFRNRAEPAVEGPPPMGPHLGPSPLGPSPLPPHMAAFPMLEHQRPSSQPNHMAPPHHGPPPHGPPPPHHHFPMQMDGPSLLPPPQPYRGHKRQRSSSVPVALSFGPRRQPMTPFTMNQHQHYHQHNHFHQHTQNMPPFDSGHNHIVSPIPQYPPQSMGFPHQPVYGQMGPPLHIDVSSGAGSGFNFDFSVPPPPSTTTGTTPPSSEFDNSLYAHSGTGPELYSAPPTQTTFPNHHFLSPVVGSPGMPNPSVSPISNFAPPEAQQQSSLSPPNALFRSHSANPRMSLMNNDDDHQGWSDMLPLNADNFTENARFHSGFEDAKFNFVDTVNWPTEENDSLDALIADAPLRGGHSRGTSMNLAFRFSHPDKLPGPLPPATPPPQEEYEFSELVCLDPRTPERERAAGKTT